MNTSVFLHLKFNAKLKQLVKLFSLFPSYMFSVASMTVSSTAFSIPHTLSTLPQRGSV